MTNVPARRRTFSDDLIDGSVTGVLLCHIVFTGAIELLFLINKTGKEVLPFRGGFPRVVGKRVHLGEAREEAVTEFFQD